MDIGKRKYIQLGGGVRRRLFEFVRCFSKVDVPEIVSHCIGVPSHIQLTWDRYQKLVPRLDNFDIGDRL